MNLFLYFVSGDFVELAKEEVFGLFNVKLKYEDEQVLVVEGEVSRKYLERLALTHEVCKFLAACEMEELHEVFSEIETNQPVCVRVRKIGRREVSSNKLERELGEILWRKGKKISVSNPKEIIKVYIANKCYIGKLIFKVAKRQFFERRPNKNPFFRPSVILPKIARALVNVTGVKEGELLLDPMCGTGTILIEAGLMKVCAIGLDYFEEIVKGCRANLKYYNLDVDVIRGDVKNLPLKDKSIDAIVTDYPYLRSSRSAGKLNELYESSISEFKRVLKNGKKIVIVSDRDIDDVLLSEFEIKRKIYQRVHKSLIRRIFICN